MNVEAFKHKIEENHWEVHGIEVYAGHRRVWEYGDTETKKYPIYSATKTVTSLAAGMAADEGRLELENPILCYMPESVIAMLPKRQKELYRDVTVKRLLTMSVPGFPFRPDGDSWLYRSLCYPVSPDKRVFDYSNVPAYLVGVAAANALEEDLYHYLQRKLFTPLGIEKPPCHRCTDGYFYGASGMELTVNELSRIGFVLLDKGLYRGERIISEAYVKEACSVQQQNREGGYGYFVWKYGDGFSINGKWGQKCYIFPERQLMITFLAHMEEDAGQLTECMQEYLL